MSIALYIAAINIVTFATYGIDKYKARHKKRRIAETTLLTLAAIGGSVGALVGMQVWHHKTKHKKFSFLVPLFIVIHACLAVWLMM